MELRPRSFGENLNEWFRSIGKHWKPLLGLCAVIYIPLGVLTIALFLLPGVHDEYFDLLLPEREIQDLAEFIDVVPSLVWIGLIWIVSQALAAVLVYIGSARVVALGRNERPVTIRDVLRFTLGKLAPGVGASLLIFVGLTVLMAVVIALGWGVISAMGADFVSVFITTVAALTAIVLMVWLGVGISFFPQSLAMERSGAIESLSSSFRLVRSRWWPTFGYVLLSGVIVSAVSQVASIVFVPVAFLGVVSPVFLAVGYGLATILQGPFVAALGLAYSVWYLDLRAREAPTSSEELV